MPRGNPNLKPGPGRPKGSKNKVTNDKRAKLSELARQYTDTALKSLVDVAKNGSDAAKVAAATALLDRGYGRPKQVVEGPGDDGEHLVHTVTRVIVDPQKDED